MSRFVPYSWSGLGLALNHIDLAIENLGWLQDINDDPRMYQKQIESLRGIRVKVNEDLNAALKEAK